MNGSARSTVEVVAEELGGEPAMGDGDDQDHAEPGPVVSSTSDATSGTRVEEQQHAGVPLRCVRAVEGLGDFSLHPQGRPCGRPPAAAVLGRQTLRSGAPHPQAVASAAIRTVPNGAKSMRVLYVGLSVRCSTQRPLVPRTVRDGDHPRELRQLQLGVRLG
jgi:hypothetical protein